MLTWPSLRNGLLIACGGFLLGLLAFAWSAAQGAHFGVPGCTTLEEAGFDPWSGLGHGRLYECLDAPGAASHLVRLSPPRAAFGFRHAVPLSIGIPAGWIATAAIVWLWPRRRLIPSWLNTARVALVCWTVVAIAIVAVLGLVNTPGCAHAVSITVGCRAAMDAATELISTTQAVRLSIVATAGYVVILGMTILRSRRSPTGVS